MTPRTLTQDELLTELRERFGADPMDWAFQCPRCKDIATGRDFSQALADVPGVTASDLLGRHCIGRNLGALDTPPTNARGCDWASYGLFSGPWTVVAPDGTKRSAFPIAPAPNGPGEGR